MARTEIKPVWNTATFLIYLGGLTVGGSAVYGLVYLAGQYHHGRGSEVAWTLLFLVILYGLAHVLRMRGRWAAAGIFAFVSVGVWAALVLLTMLWIGWHPFAGSFGNWSWSRMLFWVLFLAAAWDDRRRFQFPFIRLYSAVVAWIFVIDLLTAGGNWTAWVTLIVGLVYLAVGRVSEKPSTFWLHLIGGLLIGGALVKWFHTSDTDFAVLAFFSLLYVFIAYGTRRSSWAVLAAFGFQAVTTHFLVGSPIAIFARSQACTSFPGGQPICTGSTVSPWAPALAFGLLGFWFVLLGLLGSRKTTGRHATVVVETTVVADTPAA